ncbi:lysosomal alpha-mannosidase [Corchorus olitorius]|uniref:Lysosomal alpha-mannosidase n=1 Tax=Corchorus olitorius TaxID=93759 RepID=A0A1R3IX28_9ROSI|nr:lysosomal alpha-mannosidase [Corchorus olitorius]
MNLHQDNIDLFVCNVHERGNDFAVAAISQLIGADWKICFDSINH